MVFLDYKTVTSLVNHLWPPMYGSPSLVQWITIALISRSFRKQWKESMSQQQILVSPIVNDRALCDRVKLGMVLGGTVCVGCTVEPIMKDHPIGRTNVVSQDRWPLVTGSVTSTLKCRNFSRNIWSFKTGGVSWQWSLRTGFTVLL